MRGQTGKERGTARMAEDGCGSAPAWVDETNDAAWGRALRAGRLYGQSKTASASTIFHVPPVLSRGVVRPV
jgi:hypothetical protein